MNQFFQFLMGNLQILIYAAVFLVPALGWISRQLREQAERKKAETERKRRELEALRTGRPSGQSEPAPSSGAAGSAGRRATEPVSVSRAPAKASDWSRQGELAQRRQAQLEELRRRAAERASRRQQTASGQRGAASSGPRTSGAQTASRPPTAPQRVGGQRGGGPPGPARAGAGQGTGGGGTSGGTAGGGPRGQRAGSRASGPAQPQRGGGRQPRSPGQLATHGTGSELERRRDQALADLERAKAEAQRDVAPKRSAARPSPGPGSAPRVRAAGSRPGGHSRSLFSGRDALRNAVIASEIFGKPVSMRDALSGGADLDRG